METLHTLALDQTSESLAEPDQHEALHALEHGKMIFLPQLGFTFQPEEQFLLSPDFLDPTYKHISYHPEEKRLWGMRHLTDAQHLLFKNVLARYAHAARQLVENIFPEYANDLITARTSFRPLDAATRQIADHKNDRLMHIDAFPSSPTQGKRILRVFCNVNPSGENRVWRMGESFEKIAQRFLPQLSMPLFGSSAMLEALNITKSYRTLYDHLMLTLHDKMKADHLYQQTATQAEIVFPAQSTWLAQTDQVAYADIAGQYLLEQTFHLPIDAMRDKSLAPLSILEQMLQCRLVRRKQTTRLYPTVGGQLANSNKSSIL